MKFLDNMGGLFRRLKNVGVFLGALNAGFTAAHDYWEKNTVPVTQAIDETKTLNNGQSTNSN